MPFAVEEYLFLPGKYEELKSNSSSEKRLKPSFFNKDLRKD